jgi:hypothetical protein
MSLNNLRNLCFFSRISGVLVLATMGFCACTNSTVLRPGPELGDASSVATSADIRLITSSPVNKIAEGDYVEPKQITCSEPSPDVAKIVSAAFGSSAGFAGKAKIPNAPTSAELNTTLALSKSYAEGIAQMTERLATIQLLRDALYRACEAYANGAISATTYSAMVSRYDKTMITLLMGELAAGNFGRSLAALAGSTSAKSSAELALEEVNKREREAKENLDQKLNEKRDIERSLKDTPNTPDNAATREALGKEKAEKDSQITRAREEKLNAEDQRKQTLKAMTETSGQTTVTAAGSIQRNAPEAAAAIAADLVQMQANYLNDHNIDAVKIACITSLGKEPILRTDPNHLNVTVREDGYRYTYQRGLSVWCDELVHSLKKNQEQIIQAHMNGKTAGVPPSAIKELVVPSPHAVGPFNVEIMKQGNEAQAPPSAIKELVVPSSHAVGPFNVKGAKKGK